MEISRNSPCPCGSGKKFKQCCINKPEYNPSIGLETSISNSSLHGPSSSDLVDLSTYDAIRRLAHQGVFVDEQRFVKMAAKAQSIGKLISSWNLPKKANANEVTLLTRLLWDKLCPNVFRFDELNDLIRQAYTQLDEDAEEAAAKSWLQAWTIVHAYAVANNSDSVEQLDSKFGRSVWEPAMNWLQDLEGLLGNLSVNQPDWANTRIDFVRDVYQTLPKSGELFLFNMRRAEAESLFMLDQQDEADAKFATLIRDYPQNAWSYIAWGDEYSPVFWASRGTADPERARAIYNSGLAVVTEEAYEIHERIRLLEQATSGTV